MEIDLAKICDVCGRPGNIAFTERVGPYTIAVCHPCRCQGVTTGRPIAAEYRSPADQRQAKLRRHAEFRELPGPGDYPVTLPRRKAVGRNLLALPALCCGCLAPAEAVYPMPMPPAGKPVSERRSAGCILILFLVPLLAVAAARHPGLLIVGLPGFALAMWLLFRSGSAPLPEAIDAPVCRACLTEIPVSGQPPARVVAAHGPFVTVVFRNWEYAQLAAESVPAVRSPPTPGR